MASYTFTDDFGNTPVSLVGGETSSDIDLFDITLTDPTSDPFGIYAGSYTLLGGADGGTDTAQDNLDQPAFSVTTYAPEPGTGPAFVLVLAGAVWWTKKSRPKRLRYMK